MKKTFRPEDRKGLKQGSTLSSAVSFIYLIYARQWRKLPLFRGKVRIAKLLMRFVGLENFHFNELVIVCKPIPYKANLDLHSWLQFVAYFNHGYEEDTVEFLVKCFDRKGYFLDLGANIGLISLPFAKMIDKSNSTKTPFIYCVEAIKSNQIAMLKNIAINERSNSIVLIPYGVGEKNKTVMIQVEGNLQDGQGTGTANILSENTNHPCEKIGLEITTLDNLIKADLLPEKCSLIKIDLDGYDFKALQGAKTLIATSRPVIYGEFSAHCMGWHKQNHSDVIQFMQKFDYEIFSKTNESWRFISINDLSVEQDLLLLPTERVLEYKWCLNI